MAMENLQTYFKISQYGGDWFRMKIMSPKDQCIDE
jgi:hypothetical protein